MPIFCDTAAAADRLASSIGGEMRGADSLQQAAQMLEGDPAETLVVIGPDAPINDVLSFAASVRMARPAVGVILERHQVDVNMLTHALRAGIREVVPAGDQGALTAACERSREVSRRLAGAAPPPIEGARARPGQIVTVFAAKGGCGKTTFAINLAVALARDSSQRVCVLDLDLARRPPPAGRGTGAEDHSQDHVPGSALSVPSTTRGHRRPRRDLNSSCAVRPLSR